MCYGIALVTSHEKQKGAALSAATAEELDQLDCGPGASPNGHGSQGQLAGAILGDVFDSGPQRASGNRHVGADAAEFGQLGGGQQFRAQQIEVFDEALADPQLEVGLPTEGNAPSP